MFTFPHLFAGIAGVAEKAETVAVKATQYITAAETIGQKVGLSGEQKRALVFKSIVDDLRQTDAALADSLEIAGDAVRGAVSGLVGLYRVLEDITPMVAPMIEVLIPGSAPAVAAVVAGEKVADKALDDAGLGGPQ